MAHKHTHNWYESMKDEVEKKTQPVGFSGDCLCNTQTVGSIARFLFSP